MSQPSRCSNCGCALPTADAAFCPGCGARGPAGVSAPYAVPPMQPASQPVYTKDPPGKGFAITSLVLGIASFLCLGCFGAIPGMIFGFIALKKLKEARASTAMATAGIVLSIIFIVLAFLFILLILLMPSFWEGFQEGFRAGRRM